MRFISRRLGHQPLVEITGHSIDHILKSRYFTTYTHDSKFNIIVENDCVVKLKMVDVPNSNTDTGIMIGWIMKE